MRFAVLLLTSAVIDFAAAQTALERQVHGHTLVSKTDPAVELEFGPAFQHAGGQIIDIFKVAGAEQHFFVDAAPGDIIRRFFWVQFEHYYPTNNHSYNYTGIKQEPLKLGSLTFLADVSVQPDYFTSGNRPGSDSEAALKLLRAKGYKLEGTFVRARLFYLTDSSKRKELMIIYGERLPVGGSQEESQREILSHLRENVTLR